MLQDPEVLREKFPVLSFFSNDEIRALSASIEANAVMLEMNPEELLALLLQGRTIEDIQSV